VVTTYVNSATLGGTEPTTMSRCARPTLTSVLGTGLSSPRQPGPGQEKRAIEILDKPRPLLRPLSSTIGRLNDPILAALFASAKVLGRTATLQGGGHARDLARAIEEFKKVERPDYPLQVQLGGYRPWATTKRIWKDPYISRASKALGLSLIPLTYLLTELGRADHYDPIGHIARVYHPDLDILRHELGHAEDWQKKRFPVGEAVAPSLIPGNVDNAVGTMVWEYNANRNAMNRLLKEKGATPEEIRRANKIFSASYGSYVGGLGGLLPLGGIPGAAIGQFYGKSKQPWGKTEGDVKEPTPQLFEREPYKEKEEKKENPSMHKQAQPWGGLGGLLGAGLGGLGGYFGGKKLGISPYASIPLSILAGASGGGYLGNLLDEKSIEKKYREKEKGKGLAAKIKKIDKQEKEASFGAGFRSGANIGVPGVPQGLGQGLVETGTEYGSKAVGKAIGRKVAPFVQPYTPQIKQTLQRPGVQNVMRQHLQLPAVQQGNMFNRVPQIAGRGLLTGMAGGIDRYQAPIKTGSYADPSSWVKLADILPNPVDLRMPAPPVIRPGPFAQPAPLPNETPGHPLLPAPQAVGPQNLVRNTEAQGGVELGGNLSKSPDLTANGQKSPFEQQS